LRFLTLDEDARGHPVQETKNIAAVSAFLGRVRPNIIVLPHGHDTNVAHQRTYEFVAGIVARERQSVVLLLNEDPKTTDIRRDLVMPYGDADAAWKARLLRLHASQHERNLRARGIGFDERILAMNRTCAGTLGLREPYAEAFELACYEDGVLVPHAAQE